MKIIDGNGGQRKWVKARNMHRIESNRERESTIKYGTQQQQLKEMMRNSTYILYCREK